MQNKFYPVRTVGDTSHYGIRGKPSLTQISYLLIGIRNPKNVGTTQGVSGSIWIDELRVLEADQTPGWAFAANAGLQLADVMNVKFNINRKNPFFHLLSDRYGNRIDALSWNLSVNMDVLKLIPFNSLIIFCWCLLSFFIELINFYFITVILYLIFNRAGRADPGKTFFQRG